MSLLVILIGPPGSGKGTQGRLLAASLGLSYLASGDLLRQAIADESALGLAVRQYIERGAYVPDELMVPAAVEAITPLLGRGNGVVLDGFPRSQPQAAALERALDGLQRASTDSSLAVRVLALVLTVSTEMLIDRLAGRWICSGCGAPYHTTTHPPRVAGSCDSCHRPLIQRVDDRRETVRPRLELYEQTVAPLVTYYRERGLVLEIDGERKREDVTAALTGAVATMLAGAVISDIAAPNSHDTRTSSAPLPSSGLWPLAQGTQAPAIAPRKMAG
jgi:adenylate kinase